MNTEPLLWLVMAGACACVAFGAVLLASRLRATVSQFREAPQRAEAFMQSAVAELAHAEELQR